MIRNKKWTLAIIGAIAVLALALGGCSSSNGTKPTVNRTKTISLAKELRSKGTYMWYMTYGASQAKDSSVSAIDVLTNGKMRVYQIYDTDVTLGKLSKLSDAAAISLAKKQDKKYGTTGAQEQVQTWLDNKDPDEVSDNPEKGMVH